MPAVAFVGLPFTSGAVAKKMLEAPLSSISDGWGQWIATLLVIVALATPLLVARFYSLLMPIIRQRSPGSACWTDWWPWLFLTAVILLLPAYLQLMAGGIEFSLASLLLVLAGIVLSCLVWRFKPDVFTVLVGRVPPGDLLLPLTKIGRFVVLASIRVWRLLRIFGRGSNAWLKETTAAGYRIKDSLGECGQGSLALSGFWWIAIALCLMTLPMLYR